MTDPKKPDSAQEQMGNGMSDHAGYYDESDSGEFDTPIFGGVHIQLGSDFPELIVNPDGGSGTTFGPGNEIPALDSDTLPGDEP